MLQNLMTINCQVHRTGLILHHFYVLATLLLFVACAPLYSFAQCTFSSGSTGTDGPFHPTTDQTVQVPESGVFNFTTVNIPNLITVTFTRNSRNTPVTILATGNVTIHGNINLNGGTPPSVSFTVGRGGPGGFDGGRGSYGFNSEIQGSNGEGPGGGRGGVNAGNGSGGGGGGFGTQGNSASGSGGGAGGPTYSSQALIPLIGGSGGGGAGTSNSLNSLGASGSGGGGAILIASSVMISGSGAIYAGGANGTNQSGTNGCGGGGSGGAIRLVASQITGNIFTSVSGGISCNSGHGGVGYVRVEACDLTGFSPSVSPSNAIFTVATPKPAVPNNGPQLRITSVAGMNAPTNPSGTFTASPDITFQTVQASPVTVALTANNIPLTATVTVKLTPEIGTPTTVQASILAGTQASSMATATVTLPSGLLLMTASTTIDLTVAQNFAPIYIKGDKVAKMEITATFGGKSEITYITESGKRVKHTGE